MGTINAEAAEKSQRILGEFCVLCVESSVSWNVFSLNLANHA
jgi:hypothetical protein